MSNNHINVIIVLLFKLKVFYKNANILWKNLKNKQLKKLFLKNKNGNLFF